MESFTDLTNLVVGEHAPYFLTLLFFIFAQFSATFLNLTLAGSIRLEQGKV